MATNEKKVAGTLRAAIEGAGLGVTLLTVLPVFGPVGALTAAGIAVGSLGGAALGALESLFED